MIARFAVRHPVTVAMIFLAGMLLGVLSLMQLPVDLLPDLDAPRIAVLVRAGDRPPEELEDGTGRQLETALATLPHVLSVRTVSSTGRVLAICEYDWDADMDFALLDVQSQVAPLVTDRDIDSVTVRRFDPSAEPIMVLALEPKEDLAAQDGGLDGLRRLADDRLARALERVGGVAMVSVAGGRTREVRVEVEPHRLAELGLSEGRLATLLAQANAEASGGTVEDQGRVHVIKGLGAFSSIEEIASLPVATGTGTGPAGTSGAAGATDASAKPRPLRLSDIANITWDDAPVRGLVTVNGREGVSLSVFKEAGENTVAVSTRVHAALAQLRDEMGDHEVSVVRDQAAFIRAAVDEVEEAALLGGLLSILVLVLWLRSLRALVLVALAIPVSVLLTFPVLSALGLSLNVMTLGGIALGTGIVIDNAIVVLEATFRRLEEGESPESAAENGTSEVIGAITAATLTASVVFVPVAFLHGIAAELFRDLAITVVVQLLASLAVAVLLMPAVSARIFKSGAQAGWGGDALARPYERLLARVLRRPGLVVTVAGVLVIASLLVVPKLGLDFLPSSDSGEVTARLILPEGSRVTVLKDAAASLESAVRQAGGDDVVIVHAELGEAVAEDIVLTEDVPAENRGTLRVRLSRDRKVTTASIERVLESAASQVRGLTLRLEPSDAVLGRAVQSGPPVRVELRGQDLVRLERATESLADAARTLPALIDVHSSFEDRRAEVRLALDRTVLAGLGLTPDSLARLLRERLGAESATTFREHDEDRDVVVRGPEASTATLPDLLLRAPSGAPFRLGEVARIEVVSSPTRIERTAGSRLGAVTAHVAPGTSVGRASETLERAIAAMDMPPGIRAVIGGVEAKRRASFDELAMAVGLAVLLVYMVMASLFESLVHPFTILLTLPTALVGVVGALAITGTPLSVPAFLGIVLLAGVAVNNGILLVDIVGSLREQGLTRREAIARAGRLRLRPILMTSVTTVLGVLPLAFAGDGSDLRAPLAIVIIGGLTTSTFLTLLVIPAAYDLLDRLRPQATPS